MAAAEEENKNKKKRTVTGIDMIDRLTPDEYREAKAAARARWNFMNQAERVEQMNLIYDLVREKMRQHKGLISQADAIKEYCNIDFPRMIEQTARELEQEAVKTGDRGYSDIARSLRQTRWGIDATDFDVRLVGNDQPVGVFVSSSPSVVDVDESSELEAVVTPAPEDSSGGEGSEEATR